MFQLDSSPTYCEADTARSADTQYSSCQSTIAKLTDDLKRSLRRPSRRTLRLIDKALSYLTPFESSLARVTSADEKRDLLDLLKVHQLVLSPYIDTDRIARHLKYGTA